MRFVIEQDAGPGNRFAPDAFASQIGESIPVEIAPDVREQGIIKSAKVIDDGRRARIEVELPDTDAVRRTLATPISKFSVGTRP